VEKTSGRDEEGLKARKNAYRKDLKEKQIRKGNYAAPKGGKKKKIQKAEAGRTEEGSIAGGLRGDSQKKTATGVRGSIKGPVGGNSKRAGRIFQTNATGLGLGPDSRSKEWDFGGSAEEEQKRRSRKTVKNIVRQKRKWGKKKRENGGLSQAIEPVGGGRDEAGRRS